MYAIGSCVVDGPGGVFLDVGEAFPTNVRYSGSALAYTGANLIAGGPMPVLAAWLVSAANGSPWGVVALCAGWNVLSLAMIFTAPETFGVDMSCIDGLWRARKPSSLSDPFGAR